MSELSADPIQPDDKDWTWVLERACPDCGFDAATVGATDLPELVLQHTAFWPEVLRSDDVAQRPDPTTWSPLEYACHVRDVCRVMTERAELLLSVDTPTFANWDQDRTAAEGQYAKQSPAVVAQKIQQAAAALSAAFTGLSDDQWGRRGLRSNGSEFTVLTLGRYALHDLAHHEWDVASAR